MINTYLSIAASAVVASSISRLELGKLDVEVVLNATLAGGVVRKYNSNNTLCFMNIVMNLWINIFIQFI